MSQLSIIIPTLNEEACLPDTLAQLQKLCPAPLEVIITDGGSTDNTQAIASKYPYKFIRAERAGRAVQMNAGAQHARGQYLCFLHADTRVPTDLVAIITETLENSEISLGGFVSIMGYQGKIHYFTTFLNYAKTFWGPLCYSPYQCLFKGLRLLFGDQAMFCRREDFLSVGGFDDKLTIMEEADLCKKMNPLGKIRQINRRVYTSDRRIAQWGFWKAHVIYLGIFLLWMLRVPHFRLRRFYDDIR